MQVLNVSWKWNVPNSLSLLRLALVPAFAVLYLMQRDLWAFALLAVSGLTDCLDGFIAGGLTRSPIAASCWIRWRIS